MDRFQAMLVFKTVVEQGGFTAAARKLNLSPSAATKNITTLEAQLGAQLLNRSTRRVALTDDGQEFYRIAVQILESFEEVETSLREKNAAVSGTVRIAMPASFGRVTFTPELPGFVAEHPDIRLDIHLTDRPVDLIKEGFDLAVRSREQDDSQLIQRILHRGPMVTVAAPDYLARHGTPLTPQELVQHACITGIFGSDWRFRTAAGQDVKVRVSGPVMLRSGDTVREGAVAGLGIAQSTWWLFRKDLAAGRLVRILVDFEREAVPIAVFYPAKRNVPRRVSAVIDFLIRITSTRPPC